MKMKRFHKNAIAAILLALAIGGPTTNSAIAQDSFKIGGVVALSGAFGIIGEEMRKGAELAIEMHGGKALGVPIEISWEDTETKPDVAIQKATRLMSQGVNAIFGAVSSGSTLAMMKVTERKKIPTIITLSAADKITGSDKGKYAFRTSNTVGMEITMMASFAVEKDIKSILLIVSDFATGRDMGSSLSDKLTSKGINISETILTPLGNKDFSVVIDKAAKSDADTVVIIMTGGDAITFLKQSNQVKLQANKTIFGTIIMDELFGKAVGEGSYGVYSTLRYHFSIDTPANAKFVDAYRAKYDGLPSQFAGEAFDGMAWFLKVVDSTGSWKSDDWVTAWEDSKYSDSIEGEKFMRACDHQATQKGYFGVAVKGEDPLPAVTMKITNSFASDELFAPCN